MIQRSATSLLRRLGLTLMVGALGLVVQTGVSAQPADFPKVSKGDLVLPHGLDASGKVALEADIRAGDYARVLLGYAYFAEQAPKANKVAATKTLVDLWQTTGRMFLAKNGEVVNRWDPDPAPAGPLTKKIGDPNIATQAMMAYAAAYAHQTFRLGNLDAATYATINPWIGTSSITMSQYAMDTMYDKTNGGFWGTAKPGARKSLADQAWGLLNIEVLRLMHERHGEDRLPAGYKAADLKRIAVQMDDLLRKAWSAEFGVYGDTFNPDGSAARVDTPRYDKRTVGILLWGHATLASLLKDDPARVKDITARAERFLQTAFAVGPTLQFDVGITREIDVDKGKAKIARDEVNTGRLFDVVWALGRMHNLGMKFDLSHRIVTKMIVLGATQMHDKRGLIHDFKFTKPAERSLDKETTYIPAYNYAALSSLADVPAAQRGVVLKAVRLNQALLRDVITRPVP